MMDMMLPKTFAFKCSTNEKYENQYYTLLLTRCSLRAETLQTVLVLTENKEGEMEDNTEKKRAIEVERGNLNLERERRRVIMWK